MMAALTPKQRQFLKGLAHSLAPIVRVGKSGLTDAVIVETKKALASHELIKVRIDVEEGATRRDLAARLVEATDAHLAGTIGKMAILYRQREEDPISALSSQLAAVRQRN
jgi:RNA-binding protein